MRWPCQKTGSFTLGVAAPNADSSVSLTETPAVFPLALPHLMASVPQSFSSPQRTTHDQIPRHALPLVATDCCSLPQAVLTQLPWVSGGSSGLGATVGTGRWGSVMMQTGLCQHA